MNDIIVITDSAEIADAEFKSLRQRLTDKGLLVKINSVDLVLCTKDLMIIFWNANGGWYRPIISSDIIGYSNCRIGEFTALPILRQIRMWKRIENFIYNLSKKYRNDPRFIHRYRTQVRFDGVCGLVTDSFSESYNSPKARIKGQIRQCLRYLFPNIWF